MNKVLVAIGVGAVAVSLNVNKSYADSNATVNVSALNIRKTFYRCYSEITSLHYLVDEELVISVTKEGQIELIPYSIDMERNN